VFQPHCDHVIEEIIYVRLIYGTLRYRAPNLSAGMHSLHRLTWTAFVNYAKFTPLPYFPATATIPLASNPWRRYEYATTAAKCWASRQTIYPLPATPYAMDWSHESSLVPRTRSHPSTPPQPQSSDVHDDRHARPNLKNTVMRSFARAIMSLTTSPRHSLFLRLYDDARLARLMRGRGIYW